MTDNFAIRNRTIAVLLEILEDDNSTPEDRLSAADMILGDDGERGGRTEGSPCPTLTAAYAESL